MPLFTLKRLIADCARKDWRTRRVPKGIPEHERTRIYEEIWMALNLWLRASLEQGRGGHIPNFGRFCWGSGRESLDRSASGTGKSKTRPLFLLDAAMSRDFGAKPWRKPVKHAKVSKVQEMNFTELAIRWSTILTKDLVFSGLRDMLARLRAVIKAGYKCKVRFGCGKLLVKEGKVAFVFDPSLRIRRDRKLTIDEGHKIFQRFFLIILQLGVGERRWHTCSENAVVGGMVAGALAMWWVVTLLTISSDKFRPKRVMGGVALKDYSITLRDYSIILISLYP